MNKHTFVVKLEEAGAVEGFCAWLASQPAIQYVGSRVLRSRDCHLPGTVVLLIETTSFDVVHSTRNNADWNASILHLADFDNLIGHSVEAVTLHANLTGLAHLRAVASELLFPPLDALYACKSGNFFYVRQLRFRARLLAGIEHPHDVCAVGQTLEVLHATADAHLSGVDYSMVE